MVYRTEPKDFSPTFSVVACICESNERILLLQRQPHKPQGGTWGIPAGKVDAHESIEESVRRELEEETGIRCESEELGFFQTTYIRFDEYDFIFHIFQASFPTQPIVTLDPGQHQSYLWIHPKETVTIPLIQDLQECLDIFFTK